MLDCKILKIDNEFVTIELLGEDWEITFPSELLPDRHKLYADDTLKLKFFLDSEDTSYLDNDNNYGGKIKNLKSPKIKNL